MLDTGLSDAAVSSVVNCVDVISINSTIGKECELLYSEVCVRLTKVSQVEGDTVVAPHNSTEVEP